MAVSVFLDTNIFLHYQDFERLPWRQLLGDTVTIVIPPITLRELNAHKDTPSRLRIKRRADLALKKLGSYFSKASTIKLNDDIEIALEDRDSPVSFEDYQLSYRVNDDQLIASIIMRRIEMPNEAITLVTSDVGLTLLAKARRLGIKSLRLPDEYKLAEELEPEQQKVKELEAQLAQFKAREPKATLTFENSEQRILFSLEMPASPNIGVIQEKLRDLQEKYPKLVTSKKESESDKEQPSIRTARDAIRGGQFNQISEEDINRYNEALDDFYNEYQNYLEERVAYENLKRRSIRLEVWLLNTGTAPTEDVDIFMHFPDGFDLVHQNNFPDGPAEPKPPEKPLTQMQKLMKTSLYQIPYIPERHYIPSSNPVSKPNVSFPSIKRTNSYDVECHVQTVKHGLMERLHSLYVLFDSFETARSFQVQYRILAGNIPFEVEGRLDVIINKEQPDGD